MAGLSRAVEWVRAKDPDFRAVTRALRVTIASTGSFYVGLYVLDDPVLAIYGLFGAAAVGILAQAIGSPAGRTWVYARMLVAGWVLVTAGTYLAVNVWAAAAGMLVVGFGVAYAGVGGPVLVGAANGLQLFYILPCFPPYAPDTLSSRLVGLTIGVVAVAVLDRVIRPDPGPKPYAPRLDSAARAASSYARGVARALDGRPPADLDDLETAANDAAAATRPSPLPAAERPVSPSREDHALRDGAEHLRAVKARLVRLRRAASRQQHVHETAARLLDAVADSLADVARATTRDPPSEVMLSTAFRTYDDERLQRLQQAAATSTLLVERIRIGAIAAESASSAAMLIGATRARLGRTPERDDDADDPSDPFWYVRASWPQRWLRRLRLHLTPRSVYFQNACRIAAALVLARVLVDVLDLTHGFWVLLATLSLMRTSAADTRTSLRPAFVGTVVGAIVGGIFLTLVGDEPSVYQWALPVVMVLAYSAGPLIGLAWGQGLFTLLVCLAFVEVNPSGWRLAEARLVDVVVGGLAGALIGVLAWPRGGTGQLQSAMRAALASAATFVRETVDTVIAGHPATDLGRQARHDLEFASVSYQQHQTERDDPHSKRHDWLDVLSVLHGMDRGSEQVRRRFGVAYRVPWPEAVEVLQVRARTVETAAVQVAASLSSRDVAGGGPPPAVDDEPAVAWVSAKLAADEPDRDLVRVLDVASWLEDLEHDLTVVTAADAGRPVTTPAG